MKQTFRFSCVILSAFFLVHIGTAAADTPPKKSAKKTLLAKRQPHHLPATSVPVVATLATVAAIETSAVPYMENITPTVPEVVPVIANRQSSAASSDPLQTLAQIMRGAREFLPTLPMEGQSILPVIRTVYPTGEKPLKVLTFKCPTEVFGITPPPIKALHELVNLGMDGINKTNLLPFNMQQVCS